MTRYSKEPRTRKYVKEYGFLSFAGKYRKQLGLDLKQTASKNVVHKTAEFLGTKIVEIVKPKHVIDKNPINVEEIIIPSEKKEEIFKKLRQVL